MVIDYLIIFMGFFIPYKIISIHFDNISRIESGEVLTHPRNIEGEAMPHDMNALMWYDL